MDTNYLNFKLYGLLGALMDKQSTHTLQKTNHRIAHSVFLSENREFCFFYFVGYQIQENMFSQLKQFINHHMLELGFDFFQILKAVLFVSMNCDLGSHAWDNLFDNSDPPTIVLIHPPSCGAMFSGVFWISKTPEQEKDGFQNCHSELSKLTNREKDVLELMARGDKNTQIAAQLFVSPKTIRNHITNIFGKLENNNRSQIIIMAREAGFGQNQTY